MKKKIWIYKVFLFFSLSILINSCEKDKNEPEPEPVIEYGTLIDIDGNSYKTVKIGNQWWMSENLKVIKYRNGDPIQNITSNSEWYDNSEGAYCDFDNQATNGDKSGRLYNWSAVKDERKLAPSGWHIPSNNEWTILTDYLDSHDGCITESSGFNAIPCGFRQANGLYIDYNENYSNWWSSTYFQNGLVWCRQSDGSCNVFDVMQGSKNGFSVRCIKDSIFVEDIPSVETQKETIISITSATVGGNVISDNGAPVISRGICWSKSEMVPKLSDNNTNCGEGTGNFTCLLNSLSSNTTYYYRAYATNSEGTGYGNTMTFKTMQDTVIRDIDGNIYTSVIIGTQEWMVENLKTTRYRDGKYINENNKINYCWYDNDSIYKNTYGALYAWDAVGSKKLCPEGWHVPTRDEWTELITYLGGDSIAGAKLKEVGSNHWKCDNKSNNETGFTALPGGYRIGDYERNFTSLGYYGIWWTSTSGNPSFTNYAWYRSMTCRESNVNDNHMATYSMLSVRCIRD